MFDYEDHMVCAVQIILILAPFFLLQRKPQEEAEEGDEDDEYDEEDSSDVLRVPKRKLPDRYAHCRHFKIVNVFTFTGYHVQ